MPFDGYAQLATAGDRAVVGGIACTNSGCTEGELAFAMLAEDRDGWVRLDAPGAELSPTETEMTTSSNRGPFATFSIGAEHYSIDERGEVDAWSPVPTDGPPGSTEYGCFVSDTYVSLHLDLGTATPTSQPTWPPIVGDVHVQQVSGSVAPASVWPVPPRPGHPEVLLHG